MGGVRGRQFETSLVIFDLTWSALPSKQRLFRGRGNLVNGNIFPLIPLIPLLALAGVSVRGMWGMRGMFLVFARRRHVDLVGIGVVPYGFLERGDRLTVADPCGPTDKTIPWKSFPILRAVGLSNRLPTNSPTLPQGPLLAPPQCIPSVMAFTTSIAVKAPSPQISRMMVSAADAADASSSPTSPARINSVQSTVVPIKPAAYSIGHPT